MKALLINIRLRLEFIYCLIYCIPWYLAGSSIVCTYVKLLLGHREEMWRDFFWEEHCIISFQRLVQNTQKELEKTGCNPDHLQPKRIDTSCCVLVELLLKKPNPYFKNNTTTDDRRVVIGLQHFQKPIEQTTEHCPQP